MLSVNNISLSNENNCKDLKKFTVEYVKCKANLAKNKTIFASKNFINETKDYQKKEWSKEKKKIIKTKENIIIHSSSSKSIISSMKQVDKRGIINEKSQINCNKTNNEILYKKITGFSSWGSGQLENEIKKGDWLPQEKQENIIFSNYPEDIWGNMMKSIGFDNAEIISHSAQA